MRSVAKNLRLRHFGLATILSLAHTGQVSFSDSPKPRQRRTRPKQREVEIPWREPTIPQYLPEPELVARVEPFGPEQKEAFCRLYSQWGSLAVCADQLGQRERTVKEALAHDKDFAERYEEAQSLFTDRLHAEVVRRAVMGVPKDVYYRGEVVGQEIEYDSGLLKMLLERYRPDFRAGSEAAQNAAVVGVLVVPRQMNAEEWLRKYSASQEAPESPRTGESGQGAGTGQAVAENGA